MSFHSRDFNCFIFARLLVGRKNKELKIWTFFSPFFEGKSTPYAIGSISLHGLVVKEGCITSCESFQFLKERENYFNRSMPSPHICPRQSHENFSQKEFLCQIAKHCPIKLNNTCCIPACREPLMITHPIV